MSETTEAPPNLLYVTLIAGAAALGGFLFGFDSAVINGAVAGITAGFGSSSVGTGFAVASILLGCAVGALVAGNLADRFGRRAVMILTAVIFAATAVWAGLAGSAAMFTLARFLSGIGVGAASVVCPAYIAEISPARLRGRLASLQQLGIVIGIFAALFSDQILADLAGGVSAPLWGGHAAWRWMFLVEVIPAVLFGLAALAVPESPASSSPRAARRRRWSSCGGSSRGRRSSGSRRSAARWSRTAARCGGATSAPGGRDPAHRLDRRRPLGPAAARGDQQHLLLRRHPLAGGGLHLGRRAQDQRRDGGREHRLDAGRHGVRRQGRPPAPADVGLGRHGRDARRGGLRVLDGRGGPGRAIALSPRAGIVALVAANLYVFAFGLSWGPCVWILLGEMFPNRIRGSALAVAVFAQWIANWLVTISFPPIVDTLGPVAAYGLYLFFAVVSFFFVQRLVRETRGRQLEEM